MDRRLAEAARLGFTTALVPADCGPAPKGLRTLESATIGAALRAMMSLTESRLRVVPPPSIEETYGDGWVPGGQ
jgi:DNA repair protein RadA/Sms